MRWRAGMWMVVGCGCGGLGVALQPGCVAAAAVATTAVAVELISEQGYTLTIKADAEPGELYDELVATIRQRNPDLEVLEDNQRERRFRAKAHDSEGEDIWVSFVVSPLPDETSQLLIAAGHGRKEGRAVRQWMLERLDQAFAQMDIEWKVAAAPAGGGSWRDHLA